MTEDQIRKALEFLEQLNRLEYVEHYDQGMLVMDRMGERNERIRRLEKELKRLEEEKSK